MIEIWQAVLIILGIVFLVVLLTYVWYRRLREKVNTTMEQVDATIDGLIHHRRPQYFSETEDSLLGKFQSEILQLHDMLTSYEAREKELRESLSGSISDLVHQINTPITNIRMYSGFLQDGGLTDEEQRQFAIKIQKQADKLSWLGEGFAKVSRMESGIISLQPETQKILPILLRAIDQVTLKAQEHGNEIALEGDQKQDAYLDAKWTEEVFYNLLDNAVKYSDEGSRIVAAMTRYEMYVRVDVRNRGLKIEKEEYPKVYQRFYRSGQVQEQEGVGLGLYLAREIVRGQQGYMKVGRNEVGETVFSVFLRR